MNPIDADDAIIKEIVIKAKAERIFEALVDPRQRVKWWGAEGRFQTTHMESDLFNCKSRWPQSPSFY